MAVAGKAQQRVSQAKTVGAPLSGINDIDPLSNMGETFAIQLNNWYPSARELTSRGGYEEWATGLEGSPVTLMSMDKLDGTVKLFAATATGLYDVTNKVQNPSKLKTLTSGYMEYCQYTNIASNYLVACNGVDAALLYDGSTWTWFTEVLTPTAPGEIKGINPSLLSSVTSYKNRLWFVQKNSLTAWYLPVDAVAGELKPFYLGGVLKRGGYLVEIIEWSSYDGAGLASKLAFRSSTGEVAVYQGSDPDVIPDDGLPMWELMGIFFVAPPVGAKSSTKYYSDTILLTKMGIVPLSALINGQATNSTYEGDMSSKYISKTISKLVRSTDFVANWEILTFPAINAVIILVPAFGNTPAQQFFMNSLTGAWGKFDLPATCMVLHNSMLFFGGVDNDDDAKGSVYRYGQVSLDNVLYDGTGGTPIVATMFTAYNYFDDNTTNKHYKLVRPVFQSSKAQSFILKLNTDYALSEIYTDPPPLTGNDTADLWDQSLWDQAVWSQERTTYKPWMSVTGLGFCAAILVKMTLREEVNLVAFEVVYEPGGVV